MAGGAPSPRRGRGLGQAVATEAEKLGGGVRSGGTRRDAEAVVFPRPRSGGVLRRSSRWGWRTTGHLPSAGGSGPPRSRRGRPRWPSRGGLREPEAFGEGLQSGTWRTGLPRFPAPPPPSQGFGSVVSRRGAPAGAALQRLRGRQRAPGPRPPPPVQGSASEVFSAEKFSQPENRSFPALKNFKCCAQRTVLMLQRPDPVSPTPWATGPKLWRPRFPPVPSKVSRVQGFPRPRFLRVQASQDDEVSQDDEGRLQGQALQARCPPVNENPIRAKFIEPNRTGGHRAPRTRVSQEVALLTSPAVFFTTQGFPRPRFPRPFQPNMRNF